MKRLIGLVVIFTLLGVGTVQARQLEWPEGWSEEKLVGQYSIFSQRFGAAFDEDSEIFYIAGLTGSRGDMKVVLDFLKPGRDIAHIGRFFVREDIYFADFPKVFVVESGKIIVTWLEEIDRNRHLNFRVLDGEGNFIREGKILQSPRRITNLSGKVDDQKRVHLAWTGLGDTGLEIHYARISQLGELELGPIQITSSEKFSYKGIIIGDDNYLNLFWIELQQFSADLQYRRYNHAGEPEGPIITVAQVSMMDRAGLPVLDINLDAAKDNEDNIHLVWNAQGDGAALFRSGSDIFYARFKDGEMKINPRNLIAYWADAHNPTIAARDGQLHISWEDHLRSPVRISYFSSGEVGKVPTDTVNLNIGTNSAFSPRVFLDGEGRAHVFWYNFFQDQRMIEVKTINNRYPEGPSFWYRVGLGTENPFQRLGYILGLNFFLALLNSLTQLHFLFILLVLLGYAGRFFNLRDHTWLVVLTGFAFIILLQETGWYYRPQFVDRGMELMNAGVAGLLVIIFLKTFKDWVGIKDTVGQFIVFWLFIYWHTFFSFIPHYIQDIIP